MDRQPGPSGYHMEDKKPSLGPSVSVTFLGTCSGGGPILSRNCSSLAVSFDGPVWLFDCAEGTQTQLQKSNLKLGKINRIFITHMHADHTLGLVPLLSTIMTGVNTTPEMLRDLKAQGRSKKAKIHIYGPPGLRLLIRQTLFLTCMTLSGAYAVHELCPHPSSTNNASSSEPPPIVSPLSTPSCGCEAEELHPNEAVGKDLYAGVDGCWKDLVRYCEGEDDRLWRVDAGPIEHRVPSMGYILTEPPRYEPLGAEALEPILEQNRVHLLLLNPPIRHPRQILGMVSKTRQPYTLPDGNIIYPPKLSTEPSRKLVIMGDCSGASNPAFKELAENASLLVHECTNAWIDPTVEKSKQGKRAPRDDKEETVVSKGAGPQTDKDVAARDLVKSKALRRGHATPDVVGQFAREIGAQRLALNHFSAMFPSSTYASDVPFPSLFDPAFQNASGRAPPLQTGELYRRMVLSSIESQTGECWNGEGEGGVIRRVVAARDLMAYDVPAHRLTDVERVTMLKADREARLAEGAWKEGGATGLAARFDVWIAGVSPENQSSNGNSHTRHRNGGSTSVPSSPASETSSRGGRGSHNHINRGGERGRGQMFRRGFPARGGGPPAGW